MAQTGSVAVAHGRTENPTSEERFALARLAVAAAVALVGSLLAVLVIRYVAIQIGGSSSGFGPLRPSSVVSLTVLGVLLAAGACVALNRSRRPVAMFRRVGIAAVLVSFIPDTTCGRHTPTRTPAPGRSCP